MAKFNRQIVYRVLSILFWLLFSVFAVFSLAEVVAPGLVGAYVNPNILLTALLVLAVSTAVIEPRGQEA